MKTMLIMCLLALSFTAQSQNITVAKSSTGYIIDLAIIYNTDKSTYHFQYRDMRHAHFLSYQSFEVKDLGQFKTDLRKIFMTNDDSDIIVIDDSTIIEVSKFKAQLYKWANCKVIVNGQLHGLFSINKRDLKKILR